MALRVFTAEFGMGSGVLPLAMTTRSSKNLSFAYGLRRARPGLAWAKWGERVLKQLCCAEPIVQRDLISDIGHLTSVV